MRIHIWPAIDAVAHDLEGDECVCGPDVEYLSDRILVTHHPVLADPEPPSERVGGWFGRPEVPR